MSRAPLSWVEVERAALVHNIRQFRRLIRPDKKFLAVVKANAYGHGLVEISRAAVREGVDWLGVNSVDEAALLKKAGVSVPILILGYVPLDDLKSAVSMGARLTVYNVESLRRLGEVCRRLKKRARIHIKVETGTHRQGVRLEDLTSFVKKAASTPALILEGLSSHFANIEDTTDHRYPRLQLKAYESAIERLQRAGIVFAVKHMSCTASAILFPETYFDMVRVGIGLYGLWPSKETYLSCLLQKRSPLELRPVLSWKTRVAQLKKIPRGAYVGYGATFRATRPTRLAVLPVGYYDGYSRTLSNASHVLIRKRRAAVRGRVAMDFITADVTDIPGVRVEDEVTLIGRDGNESVTAEHLASLTGTIAYEILSRIHPGLPRLVV